ncbi:MAG: hypothetical protein U0002_21570 [Thermoanaerobaculia bacterium]
MAIDYVFDELGEALAKAAEEDKNGRFSRGADAAYLYTYIPAHAVKADGEVVAQELARTALSGCLVLAKSVSAPSAWCGEGSPFLGGTRLCEPAAQKLLAGVMEVPTGGDALDIEFGPPVKASWPAASGLPEFYAEIALAPSGDQMGILPQLVTLYYPNGIHGGRFSKDEPRELMLTASGALPNGDAGLSSVVVTVPDLKPRAGVVLSRYPARGDATIPATPGSLWVAAVAVKEKSLLPARGGGIVPVNLLTEVREVGPESPFLQLVAKWLANNKGAVAENVKNRVVPSLVDAVAATEAAAAGEARAKYDEAVSGAFKALGALSDACKAVTTTDADKRTKAAKVAEGFFVARMAQQKVLLLGESLKIPVEDRISPSPNLVGKVLPTGDVDTACSQIFGG